MTRVVCPSNTLGAQVKKIRSKNAGPFWVTIDVFCGTDDVFHSISQKLSTEQVASLYRVPPETLRRFEIPELSVLKFSFPRSVVQGGRFDRDMHGAQMSVLLAELEM
jgi:hypothetical protein